MLTAVASIASPSTRGVVELYLGKLSLDLPFSPPILIGCLCARVRWIYITF